MVFCSLEKSITQATFLSCHYRCYFKYNDISSGNLYSIIQLSNGQEYESVVLVSIYQKKNNKYIFCKKKKKTIQMTLKTKDKCLLKIDDNSLPEFSKKSSMEPVL